MDKPQIIAHVQKSLNHTLFDVKWMPVSAKFVVLGSHPRGTGALQVYEVSGADVKILKDVSMNYYKKTKTMRFFPMRLIKIIL